jgi:hypothetical protein
VHDHITRYLTSKTLCSSNHSFDCDAVLLGSLLKSSVSIGIWPRPDLPYHGISFKYLAYKVREIRIIEECRWRDEFYGSRDKNHGIKSTILQSVSSLEEQFCGLKLESFLPETHKRMEIQVGLKA